MSVGTPDSVNRVATAEIGLAREMGHGKAQAEDLCLTSNVEWFLPEDPVPTGTPDNFDTVNARVKIRYLPFRAIYGTCGE